MGLETGAGSRNGATFQAHLELLFVNGMRSQVSVCFLMDTQSTGTFTEKTVFPHYSNIRAEAVLAPVCG